MKNRATACPDTQNAPAAEANGTSADYVWDVPQTAMLRGRSERVWPDNQEHVGAMGESETNSTTEASDYYELMQISPNAEPDTIHRVYRLFAQRVHPDNLETGDETRFRQLQQAYAVLSDPEKRAQYDLNYHQVKKDRWQVMSEWNRGSEDFGMEQLVRTTVLEVLYGRRRTHPQDPGVYLNELESYTGTPREHLEFTVWYLLQKRLVERNDSSRMVITATGVDYLEEHLGDTVQRRRLTAARQENAA